MDNKTIRNTLIYQEMDVDISNGWFHYKSQKFITHVDNFYFNIKIAGDRQQLISDLSRLQQQAIQSKQPQMIQNAIYINEQGMYGYDYRLTLPHAFDIFVNKTASTIHVQLRSKGIWLNGLEQAFENSLSSTKSILEPYDISIADMTENRIDIAHHANYFQDFDNSFKEENLAAMQVSRLKQYTKQGELQSDSAIADYVAFGNRSYVFVRLYIKSKEVVATGYKQFFIPIWLEHGLISKFDKYIYDDIFENEPGKFDCRHVSRCKFYLEYGQDKSIKNDIRLLFETKGAAYSEYKKLADTCVPDLTTVVNVEFELRRDFTKNLNLTPNTAQLQADPFTGGVTASVSDSEQRIRTVIKAIPNIRRYLITNTIRFVKYKGRYSAMKKSDRPVDEWWKRLASCAKAKVNATLSRKYQRNTDTQRVKIRALTSIASLSAYSGLIDDIAQGNMYAVIDSLNDNDLRKYEIYKNKVLANLDIEHDAEM